MQHTVCRGVTNHSVISCHRLANLILLWTNNGTMRLGNWEIMPDQILENLQRGKFQSAGVGLDSALCVSVSGYIIYYILVFYSIKTSRTRQGDRIDKRNLLCGIYQIKTCLYCTICLYSSHLWHSSSTEVLWVHKLAVSLSYKRFIDSNNSVTTSCTRVYCDTIRWYHGLCDVLDHWYTAA